MVLQVGVKAVIIKNGKILLFKRKEPYLNETIIRWDILGGRINTGEPLVEALAREIKEESTLTLKGIPKLIAAQDILRNPKLHVVRLTYLAEVTGTIKINSAEHSEYRWFTPTELKDIPLELYLAEIIDSVLAALK